MDWGKWKDYRLDGKADLMEQLVEALDEAGFQIGGGGSARTGYGSHSDMKVHGAKYSNKEAQRFAEDDVKKMGKELNEVGEVIAVGPGKHTHSGEFLKTIIKVRDRVVLPTMGFTKLQFDGEEYYVGPENQILAKVTVPVEDVLAETEVTKEDKVNLTDI